MKICKTFWVVSQVVDIDAKSNIEQWYAGLKDTFNLSENPIPLHRLDKVRDLISMKPSMFTCRSFSSLLLDHLRLR